MDVCKVYNVEESYVPHRVDGKVADEREKKGKTTTVGVDFPSSSH